MASKDMPLAAHVIHLIFGFHGGGELIANWAWVQAPAGDPDNRYLSDLLKGMEDIEYGGFSGPVAVRFVQDIVRTHKVISVKFGREYSPVLYLEFDNVQQARNAQRLAASLGPDENDVSRTEDFVVLRLWWD